MQNSFKKLEVSSKKTKSIIIQVYNHSKMCGSKDYYNLAPDIKEKDHRPEGCSKYILTSSTV